MHCLDKDVRIWSKGSCVPDFHAFRVSYGVRNRITHALALAADHRLGEYMHVPATLVAALVKFEVTGQHHGS
jgi:hypothetical protein